MIDRQFESLRGETALVTGATGFLGQKISGKLLSLGMHVRILAQHASDPNVLERSRENGARIFFGDIGSAEEVADAVAGCRYVFHLAGKDPQARNEHEACFIVNVSGTQNLLECAVRAGVKRVIHCSTISVHGNIVKPPANELEAYRPRGAYEESKCEGEKIAHSFFTSGKIEGVVIRSGMIWGEGDMRALNLFRGVAQRKIAVIGDGKAFTHWVHVDDLVRGFLLAAITPNAAGETYIIAGQRPVSTGELVQLIAETAGVRPLPYKIPAPAAKLAGGVLGAWNAALGRPPSTFKRKVEWFTKVRAFDISKARKDLGFVPERAPEEELRSIHAWYRANGYLD